MKQTRTDFKFEFTVSIPGAQATAQKVADAILGAVIAIAEAVGATVGGGFTVTRKG